MRNQRKVILYGDSLILEGIRANLQAQPGLEVLPLAQPLPTARELGLLSPDVIIFDLEASRLDALLSLLQTRPQLRLVGIDLANDQMLLWSGEHSRALSMQDLVQAIRASDGESHLPTARFEFMDHVRRLVSHPNQNPNHSKEQTKGEKEMKNLSKRMKILISVAGAVVVIVVVGLALGLTGNLPLQGLASIYIEPKELCLFPGQSYNLALKNSSAAIVKWSVGDSTVVKLSNGSKSGVTATAQNKAGYATWVKANAALNRFLASSTVYVWNVCPNKRTVPAGGGIVYFFTRQSGGTWSSSNPSVAQVYSNGAVSLNSTATDGQTTNITYTWSGGSASAVLTIGSPGNSPYYVP